MPNALDRYKTDQISENQDLSAAMAGGTPTGQSVSERRAAAEAARREAAAAAEARRALGPYDDPRSQFTPEESEAYLAGEKEITFPGVEETKAKHEYGQAFTGGKAPVMPPEKRTAGGVTAEGWYPADVVPVYSDDDLRDMANRGVFPESLANVKSFWARNVPIAGFHTASTADERYAILKKDYDRVTGAQEHRRSVREGVLSKPAAVAAGIGGPAAAVIGGAVGLPLITAPAVSAGYGAALAGTGVAGLVGGDRIIDSFRGLQDANTKLRREVEKLKRQQERGAKEGPETPPVAEVKDTGRPDSVWKPAGKGWEEDQHGHMRTTL